MKKSIRVRFTLVFIGLTAITLLILWGVNNWWLEEFYTTEKVKEMEQAYTRVDTLLKEERAAGRNIAEEFLELERLREQGEDTRDKEGPIIQLIRSLNEKSNITIVVMDSSNGVQISTERRGDYLPQRLLLNILGKNPYPAEVYLKTEYYTIQKTFDPRNQSNYLESWGFFSDNSTSFMMSMPLASIRESAQLSNRFLTYVGLAVLAGGMVLIYFTTKKVISPIVSLTQISEKMSHLDFEVEYTGQSEDEIGVLGASMNALSKRLKETVGELKTANLKLQKDIEEKELLDERRQEFIANISHELKTPIALIQGYAEGLTEGMGDDPESRAYYSEVIRDEAAKMNQLVKQLLSLSALESGNDAPVMERFDLTELIREVLNSASILIEQKEARVCFEQSTPCYVWADEFKVEEVVVNYLNNALNHLDGERRIHIKLEQTGDQVRTSVFNTGLPIPEEDLPNLWTKFYKVDKARTREYGGSGIGLSIVKAIMDSFRKGYGVKNHSNGVEFWFELDTSQK